MLRNIPKPEISPAFTIDDIHKIREWNYEREKETSHEEVLEEIRRSADEFRELIRAQTKVRRD